MKRYARDGSRLYEVYIHTNKKSGKSYIGITCAGVRNRMYAHESCARLGSQKPFHRALRKFGPEGFETRVLASCFGLEAANEFEILLIGEFGTFGPGGYNATRGGDGVRGLSPTKARREQISKQFRELPRTEDHRRRISEALSGQPRPYVADMNRKRLLGSKQDLARKANSLQALAKANEAWRGSKHSDGARKAMRASKAQEFRITHPDGRIEIRKTTLGELAEENGISKAALSKSIKIGRVIAKDCGLKGCALMGLEKT